MSGFSSREFDMSRATRARQRSAAGLLAAVWLLTGLAAPRALAANPDAIWHVVHDQCVTDMMANRSPAPCDAVDLAGGFAVLKDLHGATQLLLIPTDRITGIEAPQILAPGARNYFADAWAARAIFQRRAGGPVPREDLALAINSKYGRSQNQLHIHIDCVRADVRQAIAASQGRIGASWSDLPVDLAGHRFRARRVDGAELGAVNPFRLLAEDPQAHADMGRETLVAVGASFAGGKPGFVLLSDRADPLLADIGHGEDLLDPGCAVLARR
jgi:CDP-diacylglycerol pyrophosphatase